MYGGEIAKNGRRQREMDITGMTDEHWSKCLELNAKLQQKKNSLRKALKEKGIIERKGSTKKGIWNILE